MALRKGNWAVAALVAAPIGADAAILQSPGTPSFNCDASSGGASINWGDGIGVTPSGTFADNGAELKDCVNGQFPQSLKFSTGSDEVDLKYTQLDNLSPDFKSPVSVTETELKITTPGAPTIFESIFDVTLKFSDPTSKIDDKDFVGLKIESTVGFVNDATLKFFSGTGAGPVAYDILVNTSDTTPQFFSATQSLLSSKFQADGTTAPYVALDFTNPGGATLSFDATPAPVPNPGTFGLLGSGLLGLAISARRRKNS